jgi:hypothetical protein
MLIKGWQKFYDDAISQEKSPSPDTILYRAGTSAPPQQGWNTVGGKSQAKGTNPWGSQNRMFPLQQSTLHVTALSLSFCWLLLFFFANWLTFRSFHSQGNSVFASFESCG